MKVKVLAFGIAKEIIKKDTINLELKAGVKVSDLKLILEECYPGLKKTAFLLAVNNSYVSNRKSIKSGDEIAIIPPTSGG